MSRQGFRITSSVLVALGDAPRLRQSPLPLLKTATTTRRSIAMLKSISLDNQRHHLFTSPTSDCSVGISFRFYSEDSCCIAASGTLKAVHRQHEFCTGNDRGTAPHHR